VSEMATATELKKQIEDLETQLKDKQKEEEKNYRRMDVSQIAMWETPLERLNAILVLDGDWDMAVTKAPVVNFTSHLELPLIWLQDALATIKKADSEVKSVRIHSATDKPIMLEFITKDTKGNQLITKWWCAPRLDETSQPWSREYEKKGGKDGK
jgi:hypothetical protein